MHQLSKCSLSVRLGPALGPAAAIVPGLLQIPQLLLLAHLLQFPLQLLFLKQLLPPAGILYHHLSPNTWTPCYNLATTFPPKILGGETIRLSTTPGSSQPHSTQSENLDPPTRCHAATPTICFRGAPIHVLHFLGLALLYIC